MNMFVSDKDEATVKNSCEHRLIGVQGAIKWGPRSDLWGHCWPTVGRCLDVEKKKSGQPFGGLSSPESESA